MSKNHLTESDVFEYLRGEFKNEIAAAHKLLLEFQGVKELGEIMGMDVMHRKNRIAQITDRHPETPAEFFAALNQIQGVTHPPEAVELFRQFCATYGMRFRPLCAAILGKAITLCEMLFKNERVKEEKIFSEFGVRVADTSITSGVRAALAKLRFLKETCATSVGHDIVSPHASALGDLFADEEAKTNAEEAQAKAGIRLGPARLLAEAA